MNHKVNQIIFFGFIFHVLAAVFSIGHHHCDELFQIFEFAGYKLNVNHVEDLPWEFSAQMRSGLQPFMVFVITKVALSIGLHNPFHIAIIMRLLQALFSFFVMIRLIRVLSQHENFSKSPQVLYFFAFLFWCMPYFHARFSSENFSATLFFLGLSILLDERVKGKHQFTIIGGFLFGLAFLARFQISFMILGLIAWLIIIKKETLKILSLLFGGTLLALATGLLCDYWLYGHTVFSWWNYLIENVFQNKASAFGTSPFYFYFTESFVQLIPPFSLVIIYAIFIYFYKHPKSIFTWISGFFIVLHIIVPHKELRFLFPLLYLFPVFMASFIQMLGTSHQNKMVVFITSKGFVSTAFLINAILLLVFTFKPADDESQVFQTIYHVVGHENATLFYERRNPYNNQAGLNYFRCNRVTCIDINSDTVPDLNKSNYFFRDGFDDENIIVRKSKVYIKIYSNMPSWIVHFNFSGWLQRANTYSIYKAYK